MQKGSKRYQSHFLSFLILQPISIATAFLSYSPLTFTVAVTIAFIFFSFADISFEPLVNTLDSVFSIELHSNFDLSFTDQSIREVFIKASLFISLPATLVQSVARFFGFNLNYQLK